MTCRIGRREMIAGALAAGAGVALSLEESNLMAQITAPKDPNAASPAVAASGAATPAVGAPAALPPIKFASKGAMPMGKIKNDQISRIIMGGNLIGGWAHARDLKYVSTLVKNYHTQEKILETLALGEEYGINCVNTVPNGRDFMIKHWRERGGKMKWQVQLLINSETQFDEISKLVDNGAWGIHIQGNIADDLVRKGKVEVVGKIVEAIRERGALAGYAAHEHETVEACEKAGVKADFIIKTLHSRNYWSARPEDVNKMVIDNYGVDNCFCRFPDKTVETMKKIETPWMAFKVLAAGAIPPRDGLKYAFENGADFCLLGMFDFQVAQDAKLANEVLANVKRNERAWKA